MRVRNVTRSLAVLGTALTTAFSLACGDGTGPAESRGGPDFIRASIDGVPFEASGMQLVFQPPRAGGAPLIYSVGGVRSQQSILGVNLSGIDRPGTYPVGGLSRPAATFTIRRGAGLFGSPLEPSGTLIVTELTTTRLRGTFQGRAVDVNDSSRVVVVTNGELSIRITPSGAIPIPR